MDKKEIICLEKIQDHAERTIEYCKDINDAKQFDKNQKTSDACAFNLLQIGELAKSCLTDETKEQINTIPWTEIQGLRNRIVHGYNGVQMTIIFDTIKNDLPNLVSDIDVMLKDKANKVNDK